MKRKIAFILVLLVSFQMCYCFGYASEDKEKKEQAVFDIDNTNWMEVYYFDVGQGNASLILYDGYAMMIDFGDKSHSKDLCKYMMDELNIEKIDVLIITHPHNDHVHGLEEVLDNFQADCLYYHSKFRDHSNMKNIINTVRGKGIKIKELKSSVLRIFPSDMMRWYLFRLLHHQKMNMLRMEKMTYHLSLE